MEQLALFLGSTLHHASSLPQQSLQGLKPVRTWLARSAMVDLLALDWKFCPGMW